MTDAVVGKLGIFWRSVRVNDRTTPATSRALVRRAALRVFVTRSTGLGLIAVILVSTYPLVAATPKHRAAAIGFMFEGLTAGVTNAADVTLSTGRSAADGVGTQLIAGTAVVTASVQTVAAVNFLAEAARLAVAAAALAATAGLAQEVQSAWSETVDALIDDPWAFVADRDKFADTMDENFSREKVWSNSIANFQGLLGALGPGYDVILGGMVESASAVGWKDNATLYPVSSIQDAGLRRSAFLRTMAEIGLGSRIPLDERNRRSDENIQPEDVTALLLGMGQVDTLGGKDEAVIRVMTQPGAHPTFTLIIPSTQKWLPWDSHTPNDTIGNLTIMHGSSSLERVAAEALDAAMTAYYDHSVGVDRATVFNAEVMVAGFSQGGITAAAFAESQSGTYNIVQVLTAGSSTSNFDIPQKVSVIAYEADPVGSFDGRANPDAWETITANNGGGNGFGSHDVLRYAKLADSPMGAPQRKNNLSLFLGLSADSVISDYYAIKESK